MPIELSIENEFIVGEAQRWFDENLTERDDLNEKYEKWRDEEADSRSYPYGPMQFLPTLREWLHADGTPYVVEPWHVDSPHFATRNTLNEQTFLDDDFHYTLFTLDGVGCVAISAAVSVNSPTFYELSKAIEVEGRDEPLVTRMEMDDFISWTDAWMQCEATEAACVGAHTFETTDCGSTWRYYDENSGQTVGEEFRLHEIQDDEGKTICPRCKSEIKKVGSQH